MCLWENRGGCEVRYLDIIRLRMLEFERCDLARWRWCRSQFFPDQVMKRFSEVLESAPSVPDGDRRSMNLLRLSEFMAWLVR